MKTILDIHNKGRLVSIGKKAEDSYLKGLELANNTDIFLDVDNTSSKKIDYQLYNLISKRGWLDCWFEDTYIDAQFHTASRGSTPQQIFQCKKEDGTHWDFRVKMVDWRPALMDISNDGEMVGLFRRLATSGIGAKFKGFLVGETAPDKGDIILDIETLDRDDTALYSCIEYRGWDDVLIGTNWSKNIQKVGSLKLRQAGHIGGSRF